MASPPILDAVTRFPVVTLMQPTLVHRPFHREGWVYEEKYDGWRMVAYKDGKNVRFISRAGRDQAWRFPDLVSAIRTLPAKTLILDGELVRLDQQLISRIEWLGRRRKNETATPALFMVFDCLYAHRQDLRGQALRVRRHVLELEAGGQHLLSPARRLADDGLSAWTEVLERGYEGLVAKDPASPYRSGRTLSWLKVKVPHYREGERRRDSRRK